MFELLEYYAKDGMEHRFLHFQGNIEGEFINMVVKRINKIGVTDENYCLWGIYDAKTEQINPMFLHSALIMERKYEEVKDTLVIKGE